MEACMRNEGYIPESGGQCDTSDTACWVPKGYILGSLMLVQASEQMLSVTNTGCFGVV